MIGVNNFTMNRAYFTTNPVRPECALKVVIIREYFARNVDSIRPGPVLPVVQI